MIEHTPENCELLARKVIDAWDMDGLVEYAVWKMTETYVGDIDAFIEDLDNMEINNMVELESREYG